MADPRQRLADLVAQLERHYEEVRQQCDDNLGVARRMNPDTTLTPERMTDANGRFLLLDALVALTQAQVALVQVQRDG